MDPVRNPYRPGAGRRPPALAGRDAVLTAFDVVMRRSEDLGEGDRGWILNGLRGVGKTVLLNELLRRAPMTNGATCSTASSFTTHSKPSLAYRGSGTWHTPPPIA